MAGYDEFLFGWEKDMARRNASSHPFSWQLPTASASTSRTALNDELTFNEQRHFGASTSVRRDSYGSNAPLLSDWRNASFDGDIGSPNRPHDYSTMHQPQIANLPKPRARYLPNDVLTQKSFLEWYPSGNATLTFHNDENQLESVHNLNLGLIQERSPFLALGFEESRSGPRLYLETVSSTTVYPFLRYLYSGTYALNGASGDDLYEDVPTSVLLHCQLYRLGVIYDLEELKTQAYVNVVRQCEFGCCSPDKPIDLCEAIRFVYKHVPTHEKLIDTILDYCVSCFLRHKLAEYEEFTKLAYELRPFHQALCKNSRDRGFEDEAALAIIRMPFEPYIPENYSAREDAFANRFDDVFHLHSDDIDSVSKKRKRPEWKSSISWFHQNKLPLRPLQEPANTAEESRIEEDRDLAFETKRLYTTRASSPSPVVAQESMRHYLPLRVANPSQLVEPESESEIDLPKVRIATEPEVAQGAVLSDTEFVVVERPTAVEAISDDDSDSSSLVEISRDEAGPSKMPTNFSSALDNKNDSDSEWEAV